MLFLCYIKIKLPLLLELRPDLPLKLNETEIYFFVSLFIFSFIHNSRMYIFFMTNIQINGWLISVTYNKRYNIIALVKQESLFGTRYNVIFILYSF